MLPEYQDFHEILYILELFYPQRSKAATPPPRQEQSNKVASPYEKMDQNTRND